MALALKLFRIYILHSNIIAYIPNATIKDILTQPDYEGKREKWIANIMEYDVEIKPTNLVKGQGLDNLLSDSNCEALGLYLMKEQLVPKELKAGQDKEKIMDRYAAQFGMLTQFISYCI